MKLKYLAFFLTMSATCAQARVFDINKETFAGYFAAGGGSSALGITPLDKEAGTSITYSGSVNYNYSGEFGFLYSKSRLGLRFGIEILKPSALDSTASSSGSDYYTASNVILGFAPKLALEINLHGNQFSRSFISLAGGLASVTMKNEYTMTALGSSALGVSDHTAESKGSGTLLAAAMGYENILTDTTTIAVEFGYRQLKIEDLKYTKDVSTFGGSKASGDAVKNADGAARNLDLSGGFITIGFRFYL